MRSLFVALLFLCGCKAGSRCTNDKNCAAGLFCIKQSCAAPSCKDNARNGDESDVDCGGSCPGCNAGQICTHGADCDSKSCMVGVCGGTSCSDGIKNGTESDIDCGGACGKCANVRACLLASDCQSALCQSATCVDGACGDKIKNGTESDIDCGGGSCALCADHKACVLASDCADGVCTGGSCAPPTCSDGVKNGSESDVDCGAACASKSCNVGQICGDKTDCASAHCINSKCVVCEAPADCGLADPCKTYSCDANACGTQLAPLGTLITTAPPHDCAKFVCGADGTHAEIFDATDFAPDSPTVSCEQGTCLAIHSPGHLCNQSTPIDDQNTCTVDVCNCSPGQSVSNPTTAHNGVSDGRQCPPVTPTGVCDNQGSGSCVQCNDNSRCTAPQTCGGSGTAHVCGCTPNPNACAGKACGTTDNGCGNIINCGSSCANDGHTCVSNQCQCTTSTNTCGSRCGGTASDCLGNVYACSTPCASNKYCTSGGFCSLCPTACTSAGNCCAFVTGSVKCIACN